MRFSFFRRYYYFLLLLALPVIALAFHNHNRTLYLVVTTIQKAISPDAIDTNAITVTASGNYTIHKQRIAATRQKLRRLYQQASTPLQKQRMLDSARHYLTQAITTQLIPHWYGTPWSFEGHTDTPQQGDIACGYFVSTVLNHAGFRLNRYRMAQQNPENEIRTLHQRVNSIFFKAKTATAFADSVTTHLPAGLYIFGLPNHVGFLLHSGGKVYLIHASFLFPDRKVIIETAANSPLLYNPAKCRLGEITSNNQLIRQWLLEEVVPVSE